MSDQRVLNDTDFPRGGPFSYEYKEGATKNSAGNCVLCDKIGPKISSPLVHRESRSMHKNVKTRPIISNEDVEALLSRKPNSVKNFVNSLNRQMEYSKNTVLKPRNINVCKGSTNTPLVGPVNCTNFSIDLGSKEKLRHISKENIEIKPEIRANDSVVQSKILSLDVPFLEDFAETTCTRDCSVSSVLTHIGADRNSSIEDTQIFDISEKLERLTPMNPSNGGEMLKMITERSYTDSFFGSFSVSSILGTIRKSTSDVCYSNARSLRSEDVVSGNRAFGFAASTCNNFGKKNAQDNFVYPKSIEPFCPLSSREYAVKTERVLDDILAAEEAKVRQLVSSTRVNDEQVSFNKTVSNKSSRMREIIECAFDSIFSKPFAYSPDGTNILLPVSPRPTVPAPNFHNNIEINSVNVIKAGWGWVHRKRLNKWLPKYIVLFFDKEEDEYVNEVETKEPPISNRSSDVALCGFWGIYHIYSSLGKTCDSAVTTTPCSMGLRDAHGKHVTKCALKNCECTLNDCKCGEDNFKRIPNCGWSCRNEAKSLPISGGMVLIPDQALVYLCIFEHEPADISEYILSRNYVELMEVDVSIIPSTRQLAPSGWLSGMVARSMGREPLNLIIIPLVGGFEFSFIPLCAANFDDVKLSYQMECAKRKKVGREYDQWMFGLWEFVLRSDKAETAISNAKMTKSVRETEVTPLNRCVKAITNAVNSLWVPQVEEVKCQNDHRELAESQTYDNLRRFIIDRIVPERLDDKHFGFVRTDSNFCEDGQFSDTSIPFSVINNSQNEDIPMTHKFMDWVHYHGFDDLSVKMNLYTLASRL